MYWMCVPVSHVYYTEIVLYNFSQHLVIIHFDNQVLVFDIKDYKLLNF